MMAASSESPDSVRLLLGKGADASAKDKDGFTALTHAVSGGHPETVKLLLDQGGGANAKDNSGDPLLITAVTGGNAETVKLLLDRGANVHATGANGWSALIWAVGSDKTEISSLLLDQGADIDFRDNAGWTPLMHAASAGQPENVRLLLARGADVSAKATTTGDTALQILNGDRGNAEVLKLLRAERLKLAVLLREDQFEDATLTDELVDSKNKYLPGFIATSTVEQRVALLSEVEKRLVQAQRRILESNNAAEDAIRQGQNAAGDRGKTGKIQAYMSVLKVIQKMLSQPQAGQA